MIEKLSPNFLNELFRTSFRNKNIFEILVQHLEFHYLPTQEYKEIWKGSKTHYNLFNELPTIGLLAEQYKQQPKVLLQLNQIKEADIVPQTSLVSQIEAYLKDVMFLNLYEEIGDIRDSGNTQKAIDALQKGTEQIGSFSLQAETFDRVFKGFKDRYNQKITDNSSSAESSDKCIFGIDSLDQSTKGGIGRGQACLITAPSGMGKSKALKWVAYSNARLGKKMLHFQLEGSKIECLDAYDAMITGSPYYDIKTASVDNDKIELAIKNSNKISGEIHVVAYEEFGVATMNAIRNSVIEYMKVNDRPDGIVVDYLDECDPGDGRKYSTNMEGEKARKQSVAKFFVNLCVELDLSGFIATQSSDIPQDKKNDPNFVITRSNTSGDRLLVKKFVSHVTLNQTTDEYHNECMRIYEDKSRFSKSNKTHYICTGYRYEKFYDRKRTINMFND